jgi:hypothetical protein
LVRTNVYFFDVDGRQIGALDIAVTPASPPAPSELSGAPVIEVVVYRGPNAYFAYLHCTRTRCITAHEPNTAPASDTPPTNETAKNDVNDHATKN